MEPSVGLNASDFLVIAGYLAAVTLFGLRFRRRQTSLKGYFLADNRISWWAISLSIVAAETSTLTIISVPGLVYEQDFRFLQLVFGYIVGRVIVALVLIPQYFRGDLITAYQLIDRRFGSRLHTLSAGLFLVTRAAAEGVRVFAVAIVVRIALGGILSDMSDLGRDVSAIAIVTALTLLYTFEGGMAAVIWTDVVQLAVYLAGALTAVFVLSHSVPGGWPAIGSIAAQAGKFRVFDFSLNLHTTYTFWSGVIGGAFLTTASHGTDQLIVQRLLAARSERHAKLAIVSSGFAILFQFGLFILVAAILAAAMSNLSAALNSLSSTVVVDFYARYSRQATEQRRLRVSRVATAAWAVLLFALALLARHGGKVLEMGLSIASVAYGSLLGVFLLGVLSSRASETGAITGMIAGLALNVYLWQFTRVPFTWYVVFGSVTTFLIGYVASLMTPYPHRVDGPQP